MQVPNLALTHRARITVQKPLPDLKDLLSTLPPDTPVVIFCLDNISFLGLSEDGSMNAISRCVEEDDGFHVRGALVVAPEKAMKYFLEQLKGAQV